MDKMLIGGTSARRSTFIKRKPASNLHHAVRIAEKLNLPLGVFVTLNFTKTACPPEQVSACFCELRSNRFAKWLAQPRKDEPHITPPITDMWVREAAGGCQGVHWLLHIPPLRLSAFKARLPEWLAAVTGGVHCPSAIHIRDAYNPRGAARYMSKGLDPEVADFMGIRPEAQGLVVGKRSGTSQNLGAAAKRQLRKAGVYPPAKRWKPFP